MKNTRQLTLFLFVFLLTGCSKEHKIEKNVMSLKKVEKLSDPISSLQFINSYIDLGELPEDTIVFATYEFINIGNNKLTINLIETDCTCTGHILKDESIMPGDTTELTLEFDTKGKLGQNTIYAILHANTKDKLHKVILKNKVQ